MAVELQAQIERLKHKSALLVERYRLMSERLNESLDLIQQLEESIARRDREILELRRKLEYFKVASVVSPNREELERNRAIVSQLVRDINRCINELTQ